MSQVFEITLQDGYNMKGNAFLIDSGRANFVFLTGMQEYSMRYARLASFLNDNGVNVWILDHIGQGENAASVADQQKWCIGAFDKTVEALYETILLAKQNGLPTVQGGHSMGSFMTQARLERYPRAADKTLLIGSNGGQALLMKLGYLGTKLLVNRANWDEPNRRLSWMCMGSYAKSVKDRKSNLDWLSYNEENIKQYKKDPYCGHPNTSGFWREFLKGMRTIWDKRELDKIASGEIVLISSGEEDPVGQNGEGPKWLYEQYRKRGATVTLKLYPKMRHEIHNEDDSETVYQDWLEFIVAEV